MAERFEGTYFPKHPWSELSFAGINFYGCRDSECKLLGTQTFVGNLLFVNSGNDTFLQ